MNSRLASFVWVLLISFFALSRVAVAETEVLTLTQIKKQFASKDPQVRAELLGLMWSRVPPKHDQLEEIRRFLIAEFAKEKHPDLKRRLIGAICGDRYTRHTKLSRDFVLQQLKNANAMVRQGAAGGLGRPGEGKETIALLDKVARNDVSMEVRKAAVYGLFGIGSIAAIKTLADLVNDKTVPVAIRKLVITESRLDPIRPPRDDPTVPGHPSPALPAVITAAKDSNREIAAAAIGVLGRFAGSSEAAMKAFLPGLSHRDGLVRAEAIRVVNIYWSADRQTRHSKKIVALVADPTNAVRANAIRVSYRIARNDKQFLDNIVSLLHNRDSWRVRAQGLSVARQWKSKKLIPALKQMMRNNVMGWERRMISKTIEEIESAGGNRK